jgi:hypothetical protein
MLLVEVSIPAYVYKKLLRSSKNGGLKDVVVDVTRSRRSNIVRVIIRDIPKGWWVALRILREGTGKLYMLKEVSYLDIPSKVLKLSMDIKWKQEYEKVVDEELRRWGLRHE